MDQQRSAFILPSSLWCWVGFFFFPFLPSLDTGPLLRHTVITKSFSSALNREGFPDQMRGRGGDALQEVREGVSRLSSSPSLPSTPVIMKPFRRVYFLWSLTHTKSRCWDWKRPLLPPSPPSPGRFPSIVCWVCTLSPAAVETFKRKKMALAGRRQESEGC